MSQGTRGGDLKFSLVEAILHDLHTPLTAEKSSYELSLLAISNQRSGEKIVDQSTIEVMCINQQIL